MVKESEVDFPKSDLLVGDYDTLARAIEIAMRNIGFRAEVDITEKDDIIYFKFEKRGKKRV